MRYDVSVAPAPPCALFDLKGGRDSIAAWVPELQERFPHRPNSRSHKGELTLYWVGPDHWLLRGPLAKEDEIRQMLRPDAAPDDISLILVSDTLTFYEITGPDAHHIMAIASPLDTHSDVFPAGAATYSEAFGLKALITRMNAGFELAVDRSYGDMLRDYLMRAVGRGPT